MKGIYFVLSILLGQSILQNMKELKIEHQTKSNLSYASDKNKLHILLKTGKGDYKEVNLIFGDPFVWSKQKKAKWVHQVKPMTKRYETRYFDYYFIEITVPMYRVKYAFLLSDDTNEYLYGSKRFIKITDENLFEKSNLTNNFFNYPFINNEDLFQAPKWVEKAIWYQIFPDRFYNLNNVSKLPWGKLPVNNHEFYGGNLKGITKKLSYIKKLGANAIYFTPIFKAPSAHKYDTEDYFLIDPQFGTNDDFKNLVDQAHKLGIKVMLDGVFNHAGYTHPYFQNVLEYNEQSPYHNAFHIRKFPVKNFETNDAGKPLVYASTKLNYETFALTPYMPKWNTDDENASTYLLNCVSYWIKEFKIDGWRLDVSNEISHDFLRKLRKTVKSLNPNCYIVGENWDSSYPWLLGDQLDGVMNYDLITPIWEYLEHKIDLVTFKDVIETYLATTPKNILPYMFNLVGTHDTVRIKRRLNDNPSRVIQAFIWMFISAGTPNIYYGDEVGLTGNHDPDNRRCMIWDKKQHDLTFFNFVKKMIKLRKKYAALRTPDYHFLSDDHMMLIKKDSKHEFLIIMNQNHETTIEIPSSIPTSCFDMIHDRVVNLNRFLHLQPYESYILKIK